MSIGLTLPSARIPLSYCLTLLDLIHATGAIMNMVPFYDVPS